jgi:dihydroorotate dehydrogenase
VYKLIFRPIFFLFDPEKVHHFTFILLKITGKIPGMKSLLRLMFTYEKQSLEREVFGLKFKNPVGLAAGFDKDAKLVDELATLGFGFIEIGTLTPKPQPGNDKPRLFRLKEDGAIINRMGFNNGGVDEAVARLRKINSKILIGGNIGKNKFTPNEKAVNDYVSSFESLFDVVDYFVVNVSSPNTPNLRALQDKEPLQQLLTSIQIQNDKKGNPKPILLKIAPDLTTEQLDDIVEIVQEIKLDGLIATNTTIDRSGLNTATDRIEEIGAGGLSGKPVRDRSNEVIKYLRNELGKDFPIIGVGGIMTPQDAVDKMKAGATLLQIYTGFVYEGPAFVKRINKALSRNP